MSVPRILVTDVQDRAGLAAVRCLHASGHDVTAASLTRWGCGLWSNRCSSRRLLPDPRDDLAAFLTRLEGLLRQTPHSLLLPVRDETLYAVSAHRESFERHVETGLPPHAVVELALDKQWLASQARAVGLSPPEHRVCESFEQAIDAARDFGFPVLVKGVRTITEAGGRSARYKTTLVADARELEVVQREFGPCMVERRAPGKLVQFGGVATDDGLLGSVLARCARTWPAVAGNGSYLETIPIPGQLLERVEALVASIGWRGIFQLELIERPDGTLHAIDFNPRPYGSIGVARPGGAPLVTLWCDWALKRSPDPATAAAGRRYRWEAGEARYFASCLRDGDLRDALRTLVPRRRTVHAFFEVRDPMPFVAICLVLLRATLRYVQSELTRRFRHDVPTGQ